MVVKRATIALNPFGVFPANGVVRPTTTILPSDWICRSMAALLSARSKLGIAKPPAPLTSYSPR